MAAPELNEMIAPACAVRSKDSTGLIFSIVLCAGPAAVVHQHLAGGLAVGPGVDRARAAADVAAAAAG